VEQRNTKQKTCHSVTLAVGAGNCRSTCALPGLLSTYGVNMHHLSSRTGSESTTIPSEHDTCRRPAGPAPILACMSSIDQDFHSHFLACMRGSRPAELRIEGYDDHHLQFWCFVQYSARAKPTKLGSNEKALSPIVAYDQRMSVHSPTSRSPRSRLHLNRQYSSGNIRQFLEDISTVDARVARFAMRRRDSVPQFRHVQPLGKPRVGKLNIRLS
jgi:hypothetical protein